MVGIYIIISPSGYIYIGQSWNVKKRILCYKRGDCKKQPAIYNSIVKYGAKNHEFKIIELPRDVTQEVLNSYEILYIAAYKAARFTVLNLTDGGSNGKPTEEVRLKQSESAKRSRSEKQKESARKLSELNRVRWSDTEYRKKMRGWKHTEDAIKKISEAGKRPKTEKTTAGI